MKDRRSCTSYLIGMNRAQDPGWEKRTFIHGRIQER